MKVYKLVVCAMCIALGVILPVAFHGIQNAGNIFLPMHIPVLLCGLLIGGEYGLICGVLTPILSSVVSGMPPAAILPSMICELAVYGLTAGLCMKYIRLKNDTATTYAALIIAMLSGRLVSGIAKALIFNAGSYTMQAFITAGFVTAFPGIVIQLILLPLVAAAVRKAHVFRK